MFYIQTAIYSVVGQSADIGLTMSNVQPLSQTLFMIQPCIYIYYHIVAVDMDM